MENAKPTLPDYRRLFSRIDEKGLARVLELALDRQLIVKLFHICGLARDGQDLETTAMHTLAARLAGDCFEREVTAAQVIRTLVQTSAREIEQIDQTPPERVHALLGDRTDAYTRECGRMTFAMLLDEREAVYGPAVEGLKRNAAYFAGSGVSEETASTYLRDDPVPDGEAPDGEAPDGEVADGRQTEHLVQALIEARRNGADLEKRNRILEDRVREMQRRIEQARQETGGAAAVVDREAGTEIRDAVERLATHYAGVQETMDAVREEVDRLRKLRRESDSAACGVSGRSADERVSLFVDVQNMWYAARQQHGIAARLDFEKLIQAALGERRLIRAYAYLIQTPEVDQSGFVTMLEQFSYEVKRKDLRRRSDGSAKGDWDMEMAIDMIRMAEKVDVVILASGDGDFVSLVQLLKELGPRVEVFSFQHNTARDLMEAADRYHPIDKSLLIADRHGSGPMT